MASVGSYINVAGNADEAIAFYESVFDTKAFSVTRYGDFGGGEGMPEHALSKIMNSQMLIFGDYLLQVSDHLEDFGGPLSLGSNLAIVLMPDSRVETDRLFGLLADGGSARFEPADAGFGYFADLTDKFGTNWMFFNAPE